MKPIIMAYGIIHETNLQWGKKMGFAAKKVNPEDFILSAISPEDRLNAALDVAREAFKKSKLSLKDVDNAVKSVRRKAYEKKK